MPMMEAPADAEQGQVTGAENWGDDLGAGAQVLIQMDGQPTQGALVVYDTNSELCDTSSAASWPSR